MKRCVLVLGMHRSGTSAVAALLQTMGLHLGSPLMEGRAGDNEKGFFENMAVHDFHERLLTALGRSWHTPFPIEGNWTGSAEVQPFREELHGLVKQFKKESDMWAVKDPRLCHLLPLWLEVMAKQRIASRFAIAVRDPYEVAQSLSKRNAFTREKCASLWIQHYLATEKLTRKRKRVLVCFDELLADPMKVAKALDEGLELELAPSKKRAAIRSLIDPNLRHHSRERKEVDFGSSATQIEELWEVLTRGLNTPSTVKYVDELSEQIRLSLQGPTRLLVDHFQDLSKDQARHLATVQRALDERTSWLRGQDQILARLSNRLAEIVQEKDTVAEVRTIVDERTQWITEQGEQVAGLQASLQQVERQLQMTESGRAEWEVDQARQVEQLHEYVKTVDRDVRIMESDRVERETDRAHQVEQLHEHVKTVDGEVQTMESDRVEWTTDHTRQLEQLHEYVKTEIRTMESEQVQRVADQASQVEQLHKYIKAVDREIGAMADSQTRWIGDQEERVKSLLAQQKKLGKDLEVQAEGFAVSDAAVRRMAQTIDTLGSIVDSQSSRLGQVEPALATLGEQLATSEQNHQELTEHFKLTQNALRQRSVELSRGLSKVQTSMHADRHRLHESQLKAQMLWRSKPWRAYMWFGQLRSRISATLRRVGRVSRSSEKILNPSARLSSEFKEVRFPDVAEPLVSIVIPVHNQVELTLQCLRSLVSSTGIRHEVIVVDDASSDDTAPKMQEISGLRFVGLLRNEGFVGAANAGADRARGEFVVFLNNDTLVSPGWLEALIETFDKRPDAGVVGGKLVGHDDTIQEAGGIIWRDGSGWNYGRNWPLDQPEANYLREVDYCSGALFAVRREIFRDLGGFDGDYSPGYYEDVDFCFRVRRAGLKVYYQPTCEVIHLEGGSETEDNEAQGFKRYQTLNQQKFVTRWADEIAGNRVNGVEPELEKERSISRRLLFLDHRMLAQDQDAGSVRVGHLLRILVELGFRVSYLPINLLAQEPDASELRAGGIEVLHSPHVTSIDHFLKSRGEEYDMVIASRCEVAESTLRAVGKHCNRAKTIFDTVDLHFLRESRRAEVLNDGKARREAESMQRRELAVAAQVDQVWVVSPTEKVILDGRDLGLDVAVVPTIYDSAQTEHPLAERSGILFIGGFEHPPNEDAVLWFVEEVLPIVRREIPDVVLRVVGSKPTESIEALANDGVEVVGYVHDPSDLFFESRLSVAPIRFGAGIKGKVNHSLAWGLPCVATSVACEGMELVHDQHILVADQAETFARQVIRAHHDDELWSRLSVAGREFMEEHYSPCSGRTSVLKALDRLVR